MSNTHQMTERFMKGLKKRNPHEDEFLQAVEEVVESVMPLVADNERYQQAQILERMTEPDRIIVFRVTWQDDSGNYRANRAWRVQFNNAIGPYKGGLRFHPSVNQSVLKFLGFEQTLKNSLTGLPMGGAKGGSNFNPKGKSEGEIMRFCQSMMTELHRHIGDDRDIPAGDIGVGEREIGFLFGQYKRLQNRFTGTLTGKGLSSGGSLVRKEATGYGCVYFCEQMLAADDDSLEGKRCIISGSGNVAIYTAEKALEMGATVISLSDSNGFVYDPDGLDGEKLDFVKALKEERGGRISEYADEFDTAEFHKGKAPWSLEADVAFPCATQNEIADDDAKQLVDNGVKVVCEGANMPTQLKAMKRFQDSDVLFAPAKAANAGGVAVSGLEQSQNSQRLTWDREEVDSRLQETMADIHERCREHGQHGETVDYVRGANRSGFIKVAAAMLAQGAV